MAGTSVIQFLSALLMGVSDTPNGHFVGQFSESNCSCNSDWCVNTFFSSTIPQSCLLRAPPVLLLFLSPGRSVNLMAGDAASRSDASVAKAIIQCSKLSCIGTFQQQYVCLCHGHTQWLVYIQLLTSRCSRARTGSSSPLKTCCRPDPAAQTRTCFLLLLLQRSADA